MRLDLCHKLPDLVQHIILEFLNYKWRNGKFIRQLPKDLSIYRYIKKRPIIKEKYFTEDDPEHYIWYNDDGSFNICDQYGNNTYFEISFVLKTIKRKSHIDKVMELRYCCFDRELVNVIVQYYDEDYGEIHPIGNLYGKDSECNVLIRW
jgi:hypothetical protein